MRMSARMVLATAAVLTLFIALLIGAGASDAGTLTPGDDAASFSIGDIGDGDFDSIFTYEFKERAALHALEALDTSISHTEAGVEIRDYALSDVVVKNVTEIRGAVGRQASEEELSDVSVRTFRCDISFTATRINCDGRLFTLRDGMQDLYKELSDGNVIKVGSVLKLEGKLRFDHSDSVVTEIAKNNDSNYVITKSTEKLSQYSVYTGFVEYTYSDGSGQVTKKIGMDTEFSYGGTIVTTLDYYDVETKDVNASTKAISTTDYSDSAYKFRFRYRIDDITGGYEYRLGADKMMKLIGEMFGKEPVSAGTAGALGAVITENINVPQFFFYKEGGSMETGCLFNETFIEEPYRSDDALKERLDRFGDVSVKFEDAKSNADSAYNEMNLEPVLRVSGLAAIVIIAVLATAVIILGIVIFKKR